MNKDRIAGSAKPPGGRIRPATGDAKLRAAVRARQAERRAQHAAGAPCAGVMPRHIVPCRNRKQRCPILLVGARKKRAGSMPIPLPRVFLASLLALGACEGAPVGNPPGTAAARALDRAAITNTSGAYPAQSDGRPGNPPGLATERALDRAAGTNTSGAFPRQSDGMPGNPPGTAVGRSVDRATNAVGAR